MNKDIIPTFNELNFCRELNDVTFMCKELISHISEDDQYTSIESAKKVVDNFYSFAITCFYEFEKKFPDHIY